MQANPEKEPLRDELQEELESKAPASTRKGDQLRKASTIQRETGNLEDLEPPKFTRGRLIWEQTKVYLITYIAYSIIHFEREFWSLSKA